MAKRGQLDVSMGSSVIRRREREIWDFQGQVSKSGSLPLMVLKHCTSEEESWDSGPYLVLMAHTSKDLTTMKS